MTGDERLAKVAEVLAGHERVEFRDCTCGASYPTGPTRGWHDEHQAQALAPLLEEFRAEDEVRALREAAEALNVEGVGFRPGWGSGNEGDQGALDALGKAIQWLRDRAALAAAEPDAGER